MSQTLFLLIRDTLRDFSAPRRTVNVARTSSGPAWGILLTVFLSTLCTGIMNSVLQESISGSTGTNSLPALITSTASF